MNQGRYTLGVLLLSLWCSLLEVKRHKAGEGVHDMYSSFTIGIMLNSYLGMARVE